jgi:hypothetical protein
LIGNKYQKKGWWKMTDKERLDRACINLAYALRMQIALETTNEKNKKKWVAMAVNGKINKRGTK